MATRWRLAVLAGLFTLVTACGASGNDGSDGVASVDDKDKESAAADKPKGTDEDQMRAFAQCMRDHGIDMKDPEVKEGGGIEMGVPAQRADGRGGDKAKAAMDACNKLMPNGGKPPKPSAKDLDDMRTQAKCLREHGIDVPDPTMDEPFIKLDAGKGDGDAMKKAMKECGGPEGRGSATVREGGGK
jgi:hypothetical protein